MIKLKEIVQSFILSEISENTILYHRSNDIFKEGDILNPKKKFGDDHHQKNNKLQQYLENYRKENFPDKPSRLNCVFCSVIPNSAFMNRGYLYEVTPIGKTHITLAFFINKINTLFSEEKYFQTRDDMVSISDYIDRYGKEDGMRRYKSYQDEIEQHVMYLIKSDLDKYCEWYWKGVNYNGDSYKKDTKWVEVLCEQVKVKRVYGSSSLKVFKPNDIIKNKDEIQLEVYTFNGKIYKSNGNVQHSEEETKKIFSKLKQKRVKVDVESKSSNSVKYVLTFPKNFKFKISRAIPAEIPSKSLGDQQHSYKTPYRMFAITPKDFDINISLDSFINGKKLYNLKFVDINSLFEKV